MATHSINLKGPSRQKQGVFHRVTRSMLCMCRTDSVCSDIAPIVYHGSRALKDNQDHQYSHLYTLFSMIKKSDLKLSGKSWLT